MLRKLHELREKNPTYMQAHCAAACARPSPVDLPSVSVSSSSKAGAAIPTAADGADDGGQQFLLFDVAFHEQLNKQRRALMFYLHLAMRLKRTLVLPRPRLLQRKEGARGSQFEAEAEYMRWGELFNVSALNKLHPAVELEKIRTEMKKDSSDLQLANKAMKGRIEEDCKRVEVKIMDLKSWTSDFKDLRESILDETIRRIPAIQKRFDYRQVRVHHLKSSTDYSYVYHHRGPLKRPGSQGPSEARSRMYGRLRQRQ